jgi:hypothetical protein
MPTPPPAPPSSQRPNRVQFPILRKEDFSTDAGVSSFNLNMAQFVTTINNILGDGGATQFPAGLDVAGAKVTGLAEPSGPTDAVSQSHVASNYGSSTQSTNLDIGGSNTLKGLAAVYGASGPGGTQTTAIATIQATLKPGSGVSGTITIPKISVANGSITVLNGVVVGFVQPT